MSDIGDAVASAARTATGSGAATLTPPGARTLGLMHNVTVVSGVTPTMTLSVEWSADGTTFVVGEPADTFTEVTAAAGAAKSFTIKAEWFRIKWTIGGTTPSFTFSVSVYGV